MDNYLEDFKKKALEVRAAGKLAMFSNSTQHVAYKEIGNEAIHVRYICPCGNKNELHEQLKAPYKVKCSACKKPVWVSKIRKKKGLSEPVAI